MTGTIYCIENTLDDKMYIGQTVDFERRMYQYATGTCHDGYIRRAIVKHGWKHFSVKVVEEIPVEDLDEAERFWIAFLDTMSPNGYNLRSGGHGGSFSLETRELLRESALRRVDDGTHNLQGENNPSNRRLEEGTHNFQQEGFYERLRDIQNARVADGTHHFVSNNPLKNRETMKRKLRTERKNKGIIDWVDMLEEE